MMTQYGQLPIVVDPSTGRAKMVQGGVERTRPEVGKGMPGKALTGRRPTSSPGRGNVPTGSPREELLPTPSAGSNTAPAPIDAYDSKLEAARHRYWGYLLLAGDIRTVIYHPFTIHLTPELDYTPDFFVCFHDGRIQVEEVKGHLEMKNVRDSVTRLKMAADRFPMWTWLLTTGPRTQWTERHIGGPIPSLTPQPPRRQL
jgi:hypothetical protein